MRRKVRVKLGLWGGRVRMRVSRWIGWWVWVRGWSVRWGRWAYRNTCFSPFGGLKRSGTSGRRGSGEGLRRRAGLGRTRGTAATLATEVFMMALGAFMVWLRFWGRRLWKSWSRGNFALWCQDILYSEVAMSNLFLGGWPCQGWMSRKHRVSIHDCNIFSI